MKRLLTLFFTILIPLSLGIANGVAIVDASKAIYLRLDSTTVDVGGCRTNIQNNHYSIFYKHGFSSRCEVWISSFRTSERYPASLENRHTMVCCFSCWDKTGYNPAWKWRFYLSNLVSYLGKTPLYFSIPQPIQTDSTLAIELTYVEFLPYVFGNVNYVYPSDYHLIQSNVIGVQRFDLG